MIGAVKEAHDFLNNKFPDGNVVEGVYAVPTQTSKGAAFMRIVVNVNGALSGFELFLDEELTISWYD